MSSIGCRAAATSECLLHLLLWWIKPEPAVRAFFRLVQTSTHGLRAPTRSCRFLCGGLWRRILRGAGRARRRCRIGRRLAVATRAEMAHAFAYRAQASNAILGVGGACLGDACVERIELRVAAGMCACRRCGGEQRGRKRKGKSLFHHACLLFSVSGRARRGPVPRIDECSARRSVRRVQRGTSAILADFRRAAHRVRIPFDRRPAFPL